MMIRGGGAAGTAGVQLAIVQAQRGTVKTAREVDEAASEKRVAAERESGDQRIKQMEAQLAAADTGFFSMFGGALLGVVSGFAMSLGAALGGPLIGAIPAFGGATGSLLFPLCGAAMNGAVGGLMLGSASRAIFQPLAAYHENNASDAELRVAELEQQVALLETEAKDADVDIDRARQVIKDVRSALSEMKKCERERKVAGGEDIVAGGASAATPEMQEALRAIRKQQEEAAHTRRSQNALAKDLHISSLAQKRAAIEERKSNAVARAVLGIVELAAQVAAAIGTGGGYELLHGVAQLTSAGSGLAGALITDQDARAADRASEERTVAAEKAGSEADEAREDQAALDQSAERTQKALLASKETAKGDRPVAGGSAIGGVAAAQRIVAKLASDEERSAKIDRNEAREEKIELAKSAIEERRKADKEQQSAELFNVAVAGVGVGLSVTNFGATHLKELELGKEAAKGFENLKLALDVTEQIQSGARLAAGIHKYVRDDKASDLRMIADQIDVQSQVADDRAQDATERRDDARDRRQRALDLAVSAGRGASPV